jgi:membrane protein YqaA with SNARE-associated domain
MIYISLFFLSFLAATIIPFSSEVGLASLLKLNLYNDLLLLISASVGNILGSCVNWYLGIYSRTFEKSKWFPFDKKNLSKASNWFEKYGKWSLLLSWMPVVGDPITFIAGTMKTKFKTFIILVSISKISRYLVILILFN